MAEPGRTEPFSDVISIVAGPIAAGIRSFEQLRKGAEELMRGLENFNATMENLNDTASRVNRLLNDFEEPIRAMLPQMTRVMKAAEEASNRLSGPLDQIAPGLTRLADTLDSPVMRSFPNDLGKFMEVINDLGRRMSPLGQIAEQAGSMFGLRIPGFSSRSSSRAAEPMRAAPPPPSVAEPEPVRAMTIPPAAKKSAAKKAAAKKSVGKKTSAARKSAATSTR